MNLFDLRLIEVVTKEDLIFTPDELKELARKAETVNLYDKKEVYKYMNKQACYFEETIDLDPYSFDIEEQYDNFEHELNLLIRFTSIQFGPTWYRDIPNDNLVNEILNCYRETEEFSKDINNAKYLYNNSRLLIGTALVHFRKLLSNNRITTELRNKYNQYIIALENYIDVTDLV